MFNVNRVTLLGNATRAAESFSTKSGQPLAVVGMATNRRWKDGDGALQTEAEFHRLVCFGSLAEFAAREVTKGTPLYVEGRIHASEFQTKKGENASRTEIIVDRLVLLSSKKKEVEAVAATA